MSTDDVRAFVKEHFGQLERVEWVDDQSANLLFPSESTAQDALQALSAVPVADAASLPIGEMVPAKPLSSNPEVTLQIRFALASDKKVRGAAARSRYYLFHPDQDPEARKQRDRRYRDRGGDERRNRRRHGRGADDDEVETYDAGMYDDDEATLADRAAKARSQDRSRSRGRYDRGDDRENDRRRNQDKELFPTRRRNRSASPLRDRDGDAQMDADETAAGTSNNRRAASGLRERLGADNKSKELFPAKPVSTAGGHMDRLDATAETTRLLESNLSVHNERGDPFTIKGAADRKGRQTGFAIKGAANAKVTELFPAKFGQNTGKELFSDRLEGRSRQRKKAEDLFY